MNAKELGRTGQKIPEIGFGTWKYQAGAEPIRRAIDLGASLIDTAEYYGNEALVGRAIGGLRDKVFLAGKVSAEHFRREALLKSVEQSLRLLGTDHIDLYQLHWPNPSVPIEETMGGMEEAADQGKVRYIGVSNFSLPQLRAAQKVMRKHQIVSNQVRYSLVDRDIESGLLAYCQEQRITVIAYSPLARGLTNLEAQDPNGVLPRVAEQTRKTPAQVALNWCISKPGVVTIPKASSVARVEENCGASGWTLTPNQLQILEGGIRPERRSLLAAGLRRIASRFFGR